MAFTENPPFRRVLVNHVIDGVTRVWWHLVPEFNDPLPHRYQLQVSMSGLPTSTDWEDVGTQAENSWYAEDDQRRLYGKLLYTHYRVKLTTPTATYVSAPVSVHGELDEHNLTLAREIIRKEQLRMSVAAGRPGYLLKRMRFGARCTRCLDTLSKVVTDSRCPECRGTGFKVGFHAAVPMQCWDLSPETIREVRSGAQPPGSVRPAPAKARVLAAIDLALEDVWVDGRSGQRWYVQSVTHTVAPRGVPVIFDVEVELIEFTDAVYRIPVGGERDDHPLTELPDTGTGCVAITHDYGGPDTLAYQTAAYCGIGGADVRAFLASDYAAGLRQPTQAKAITGTDPNGRWLAALNLSPGDYVIEFEKPGSFGPDTVAITVTAPPAVCPPPSSSQSSQLPSLFIPGVSGVRPR